MATLNNIEVLSREPPKIAENIEEDEISIGSDFDDNIENDFPSTDEALALLEDSLPIKPKKKNLLANIIIIDNLPLVGFDKVEKLKNLIKSKISKFGNITNFEMPMDDTTSQSFGFCYVTFEKADDAKKAAHDMDGVLLDRTHALQVVILSEVQQCFNVDPEWKPPAKAVYVDHGNLQSWLLQEGCWDQFAVVSNIITDKSTVTIFWNTSSGAQLIESRNHWTESILSWSPRGTYLCTFHPKGICLWGGDAFKQIHKFLHLEVSLVDFSPCERFMVTYSSKVDSKDNSQPLIVWDVGTFFKRGFHHEMSCSWPVFKWNFDSKYFARLQLDAINVYETPSFGLLDKTALKLPGVLDFSWSPTENILAYWVREADNSPARVVLLEMPSRKEICVKNLFSVSAVKMFWQSDGDYLCVLVTRFTKKKVAENQVKYSGLYYNFEIFRIREKHIPVDKLETKDQVTMFAWEPKGTKFAFIFSDVTGAKIQVSVYDVRTGGDVLKLKTFERVTGQKTNELKWSPRGGILVLAGIRACMGNFEFVDTSDMTSLNKVEHLGATDIEWDPTGRYVATWVSCQHSKQDCHLYLWSSTGRFLYRLMDIKVVNKVLWRPRPPSLLKDEDIKAMRKGMKEMIAQFEKVDRAMLSKVSVELAEKRKEFNVSFRAWRKQMLDRFVGEKSERMRLRGGVDSDQIQEITTEVDGEEEEEVFLVNIETTLLDEK